MSIKWIEHKGKRILYVDFRKARDDKEMIAILFEEVDVIKKQPGKTLVIVNFEDVIVSTNFLAEIKELGKEIGDSKVEKAAALVITGVKKIFADKYNAYTDQRNNKIFDNEENAKEWLVS